jgi:hypothetical protein
MSAFETEITREDALLWLNDRLGQQVGIVVTAESGADVFEVRGELAYWRDVVPEAAALDPTGRLEDLAGLYHVGEAAALDLSDPDLGRFFRGEVNNGTRVVSWLTLDLDLESDAQIRVSERSGS